MRILVEPPTSSHCEVCGGELRLKLIESANPTHDLDSETSICVTCGHEQSFTKSHDPTMPAPKAA